MTPNKEAARVLAHPNGKKCGITKNHKIIVLQIVRFGKLFAKTCAVGIALLGLCALAGAAQGGGLRAVLALIAATVTENWTLGAWHTLAEIEKEAAACEVS